MLGTGLALCQLKQAAEVGAGLWVSHVTTQNPYCALCEGARLEARREHRTLVVAEA